MNIGSKITELRKKNNLTQEKLAEKLKISRQTLSNWESNVTSPNLDQASQLSKELKVSLDALIDNNLDIVCKNKFQGSTLNDLIGKKCILELDDEYFDINVIYDTKVQILEVNSDFIKIEYKKGEKTYQKLIDLDLIVSIRSFEEE